MSDRSHDEDDYDKRLGPFILEVDGHIFHSFSSKGPFWSYVFEPPSVISVGGANGISAKDLRHKLKKHARGENILLGDEARQSQFICGLAGGLEYISRAKRSEGVRDGENVSIVNRSIDLRASAFALLQNIERMSADEPEDGPCQRDLFEGKIGGTGLLETTRVACLNIIARAEKTEEVFGGRRGGKMRRSDIMGVKMIASSWRNSFEVEPSAKGAFGEVLNAVFQSMAWPEVAQNTLATWLAARGSGKVAIVAAPPET